MMKHRKVIVVGCGPAGTACGYVLQKHGHDCLLIDRFEFPREKLCGGGITPKAQVLIAEIFDNVPYQYTESDSINILFENKQVHSLKLGTPIKVTVRKDFDATLLKAYTNIGGEKLSDALIGIEEKNGLIYVSLLSGATLTCDYLVGADGSNSRVRKYLNKNHTDRDCFILEKTVTEKTVSGINVYFDRKLFKQQYMYSFPNPSGFVIGFGGTNTNKDKFQNILNQYGLSFDERTKGAFFPIKKVKTVSKNNIFLAGDAGGFTDAMTGEGIYFAVKTGRNAALSIINGSSYIQLCRSATKYAKKRRIMGHIFYSRIFQNLFYLMCKKNILHNFIRKAVDRAMSHHY